MSSAKPVVLPTKFRTKFGSNDTVVINGERRSVSFFDQYEDVAANSGSGSFLKAPDKQFLIENGVDFLVVGLVFDEDNQYGERYIAAISCPNEDTGKFEARRISFPVGSNVPSRDAMMKAMHAYMEGDDAEPVPLKLTKVGNAIVPVAGEMTAAQVKKALAAVAAADAE